MEGTVDQLKILMCQHKEKLVLFLIVVFGFVFRILVYTQHPYSYGIDGPYYNLQVQSILETGQMYQNDPPFIFYYFTLWYLLLGDTTLAIKFGISVLSSLIAVPSFLLGKRVTRDWRAGGIAAFLSLFDPLHMQLLENLLKNTAGILFMLCFLYMFLKTCERPHLRNYLISFSFLLLTFLTHIHPSGLAILFVLVYVIALGLIENKLPKREVKVSTVLFGFVLACLLVVFASVPGALAKFSKIFSFVSSLATEAADQIIFLRIWQVLYLFTIPIVLGLTYIIHDIWKERSGKEKFLFLSIFIVCLSLSLPFVPQEWRWRFFLVNFVPLALFAGYGLSKATKDLPRLVIIGLIVVVLSTSFVETVQFAQRMGPIINGDGIKELERLREMISPNSVIIVQGRVFYWVQLITDLKTFHGKQNPAQLYLEYGEAVYTLLEKDRIRFPLPPEINKYIILDDGPYIIFLTYPR